MELRADPELGLEAELAPVPPDAPVADRQAEPRPPWNRFGREKRVEDLLPDLVRDAGAVILDGYGRAWRSGLCISRMAVISFSRAPGGA